MTSEAILHELPGGEALSKWFGHVPHFHDANLLEVKLSSQEQSVLRVHTWEITDKTDARGYFVLDRHVVVTITLNDVTNVALDDFNLPGIIHFMKITKVDDTYQFAWGASYGVRGAIRAKHASFALAPGKP
ncbi:MAG TPA: Imm50 family immunity protein [Xanthobacteraceae bacterium]|nr:Imm50 family immunity protein [Xanthobacteraceae bacterium]